MEDLEGRLEVVILEKEVALKEERDRMEKNLRIKAEKLELEKEAWQNLIITTKNKNTALEEDLDKAIKQYNDDQREWYDKMDKVKQDRRLVCWSVHSYLCTYLCTYTHTSCEYILYMLT